MAIASWLRARSGTAVPAVAPRPTSRPAVGPARTPAPLCRLSVLRLEEQAVAAAWSPAQRRLAVPAEERLQAGEAVVIRIARPVGPELSLVGIVAQSTPAGEGWRVTVAPGVEDEQVVHELMARDRGDRPAHRVREPRYPLSIPAVVGSAAGRQLMTTTSVSLSGCGLAWSGPRPPVGGSLDLQMGSARTGAAVRARVAWVREAPRGLRVGLRLVGGDLTGWARFLVQWRRDAERPGQT